MGGFAENQEKLETVKKLMDNGRSFSTVVAESKLTANSVKYYIGVLRRKGLIPYARTPVVTRKQFPTPSKLDGVHQARAEQVEVVVCPRCKTQIQVVR